MVNDAADNVDGFACPHCGAYYSVKVTPLPAVELDSATCGQCGKKMAEWASKERRNFRPSPPAARATLARQRRNTD